MKTTITKEFTPEEIDGVDYYATIKGSDIYMALHNFKDELRKIYRNTEFKNDEECAIVEKINKLFYEIMNEYQIDLEK